MCVGYQQVHHVWFVVSQRFNCVKDVDTALLSQHLADYTDTAENSTAPPSIPGEDTREDEKQWEAIMGGARRKEENGENDRVGHKRGVRNVQM